ncbi:MAG: glycosyltransferase [Flavobacteriales bacterium]|nr:glycosyltransferase [Flavobacteriales bacterium]
MERAPDSFAANHRALPRPFVLSLIAPYILYTLVAALVVLAFFHLAIFSRLAFKHPRVEPDRTLPVSIVVCARNESNSLQQLIPLLMDQDHGEFEVVVVNDRSEDDTWEMLQWMKPEHPRLRPVNIQADEKFSYGKKIALGVGIRSAKYDHVLLTDADCMPVGRDWVSTMCAGFRNGKKVVIAFSPYEKQSGFTNLIERYDGVSKAMQYISFAQAGLPYMGVGRNLGYTQDMFLSAKGPRRHTALMSGDDDLFINEVARANNTTAIADGRSFMTTRATPDLITWLRRKRRHYTTARFYRFGHQVLLTLLPMARFLLWATVAWSLVTGAYRLAAIGAAVELFVFLPIRMLAMRRLGAGGIIWLILPLEWLFLLLEPSLYVSTLLIKPRRWK